MRIDPGFESGTVAELHRVLTHGAGDLPQSIKKILDDAESLIVSLLRQREIMRNLIEQMAPAVRPGGLSHRKVEQILLDVPASSPITGDFAGAPRTIQKPS